MWGDLVGQIRRGIDDVVEVWNEVDADLDQSDVTDNGELADIKNICGLANDHAVGVCAKDDATLISGSDLRFSESDSNRCLRVGESDLSSRCSTPGSAVAGAEEGGNEQGNKNRVESKGVVGDTADEATKRSNGAAGQGDDGDVKASDQADQYITTDLPEAAAVASPPDANKVHASASDLWADKLGRSTSTDPASVNENQMLRLQKQLAAEVETAQNLYEQNAALKARLEDSSAATAWHRQDDERVANMKSKMAWLVKKLMKTKSYNASLIKSRGELRDKLNDAEIELQELRSVCERKDSKIRTNEANGHDSAVLVKEMTAKLTDLGEKLNTRAEELEETERVRDALVKKLEEVESTYTTKISMVQSSAASAMSSLQEELAYTKATLQNCTLENKNRVAELEQELRATTMRARSVELNLHEEKRRTVELTAGLRSELGEMSMRATWLTSELKRVRNEYERAAQKHIEDRQKCDASEKTITQLTKRYNDAMRSWEGEKAAMQRQHDELRDALTRAQGEAATAQKEVAKPHAVATPKTNAAAASTSNTFGIDTSLVGICQQQQQQDSHIFVNARDIKDASAHDIPATADNAALTLSAFPSRKPLTPPATLPVLSFMEHRSNNSTFDTVDTRTCVRLQKELIRLSMEMEQSRSKEAKMIAVQNELADLRNKHDVLLQMYGQLLETVNELQANSANADNVHDSDHIENDIMP